MKKIPLTQGKYALVDDEDYEWLMQWKWFAVNSHGIWYAARNSKYRRGYKRKMIQMHREIMRCPVGREIHHIDHNGLNDQRVNMQIVTHRENCHAQRRSFATGIIGVVKRKDCNRYEAQITAYGKHHHLGLYKTKEEAAVVREQADACVADGRPITI